MNKIMTTVRLIKRLIYFLYQSVNIAIPQNVIALYSEVNLYRVWVA